MLSETHIFLRKQTNFSSISDYHKKVKLHVFDFKAFQYLELGRNIYQRCFLLHIKETLQLDRFKECVIGNHWWTRKNYWVTSIEIAQDATKQKH